MNDKKLYFSLDDNDHIHGLIMELSGCLEWIKSDTGELSELEISNRIYTLTPIWLTDDEYKNLPEANL